MDDRLTVTELMVCANERIDSDLDLADRIGNGESRAYERESDTLSLINMKA